MIECEGVVGSKGELFLPKKVREVLGLKPGMKVIYRVEGDKLIVEPIPRLEDVLSRKPVIEITLEEFQKFRRGLSNEVGTSSNV